MVSKQKIKKHLHQKTKTKPKNSSLSFDDYARAIKTKTEHHHNIWLNDQKDPKAMEYAHRSAAIHTLFKQTAPKTRLVLYEHVGENVEFVGIVTDVRRYDRDPSKGRILISSPVAYFKLPQKHQEVVDSHVWILTEDIIGAKTSPLIISIGDIIVFTGDIKQYYGKVDKYNKSTKYGIENINVTISGLGFYKKGTEQISEIINDYPRKDDWILKWEAPGKYKIKNAAEYIRYYKKLVREEYEEDKKKENKKKGTKNNNVRQKHRY